MTFRIAAMPAYNEAQAIAEVIKSCKNYVDKVVVVDDGSVDNTFEIAESLGAYVVRHETNKGYGAAIKNCFETARQLEADAMVIIDSDGQHNPSEIPKLLEPLEDGFDIVIGSRFVNGNGKNVPIYRKFGMKVLDITTFIAGGLNVTDSQSGFRAYGRLAIEKINLHNMDMSAGSEILIQAKDHKLKFTEVEIQCRYDIENCSSEHPFIHGPKVMFRILKSIMHKRPIYYSIMSLMIMTFVGLLFGMKFLQDYNSGGLYFGPTFFVMTMIIIGICVALIVIIVCSILLLFYPKQQVLHQNDEIHQKF